MSIKRTPKGIRRHYSEEEKAVLQERGAYPASEILGRPLVGTRLKEKKERGEKIDTHYKDPSGKYLAQEETKPLASRNRKPWEPWEDQYLLSNPHLEPLKGKALHLGRTYRAVESRRRDLLREIDRERGANNGQDAY